MRIYLDMCTLQRPLDDPAQLRVRVEAEAVLGILALVGSGKLELLNSNALVFEMRRNPYPIRRDFAEEVLARAKHMIVATAAVEQRARAYEREGIKPLDALHLACAVEARADVLCTCDDKFLRRARALDTSSTRLIGPLELIEEIEL